SSTVRVLTPRLPAAPRVPYTTLFRSPLTLLEHRKALEHRGEVVLDLTIPARVGARAQVLEDGHPGEHLPSLGDVRDATAHDAVGDRKSTRLNSSHQITSYAVFCL